MAIQPIKLNLVPEPSLWRERHLALGWAALAFGLAVFIGVSGYTAWSYHRASQAGKAAVNADAQTRFAATQERQILNQLQQIDVDQELPRWRLAERILSERAAPWSRLAAELEQSLVDGARIKNVERARGADQAILLKVKAEARSRDAETGFIENLRKDPVFSQVILEREGQQAGGGWEFDLSLPVVPLPPPFVAVSAPAGAKADAARQVSAPPPPAPAPRPQAKPQQPAAAPEKIQTEAPARTAPAQAPRPFNRAGDPRAPARGSRPSPAIPRRPQPGGAS